MQVAGKLCVVTEDKHKGADIESWLGAMRKLQRKFFNTQR